MEGDDSRPYTSTRKERPSYSSRVTPLVNNIFFISNDVSSSIDERRAIIIDVGKDIPADLKYIFSAKQIAATSIGINGQLIKAPELYTI